MLSSRLNALVMPTIQRIEKKRLMVWYWVQSNRKPKKRSNEVMMICPASLCCGSIFRISSARPSAKIPPAHNSRRRYASGKAARPETQAPRNHAAIIEQKMLTPPRRGVSRRCQRLSLGMATIPVFLARRFVKGVRTSANTHPSANGRKK